MTGQLLTMERRWWCPACKGTTVESKRLPKGAMGLAHMHNCRANNGLSMPMVLAGTKAKVELVEREDYVGKEHVRLHNGRPIMAAKVTRDDGQDVAVYAPAAVGSAKELR